MALRAKRSAPVKFIALRYAINKAIQKTAPTSAKDKNKQTDYYKKHSFIVSLPANQGKQKTSGKKSC